MLTKARQLTDITRDITYYHHSADHQQIVEVDEGRTCIQAKRARVQAVPIWLEGRVKKGLVLPEDMVVLQGSMRPKEEKEVVEYVTKRMNGELFVELMEMMG